MTIVIPSGRHGVAGRVRNGARGIDLGICKLSIGKGGEAGIRRVEVKASAEVEEGLPSF